MKMIKQCFRSMAALIVSAVLVLPVYAEVLTTPKTEGFGDYMYVAGSRDDYPFEYYDKDTEEFKGIVPDMLKRISEESGIDFVYINGSGKDKIMLAENLQVEVVCLSEISEDMSYVKDSTVLFSFESDTDEIKKYYLACTEIADADKFMLIENAVKKLSDDEKNGIYLSYASEERKVKYVWIVVACAFSIVLLAVIVYLVFLIRKMQRKNDIDRMTDPETGMGNMQFFKYHFRYTLGDISRSLYYLAYIILDSSYLRSYHGDNSFEEVLKHTALVLSEYTGDREISARITENGFAFAFQSGNDEDANIRLKEIMTRLNCFEQIKEENNKLVFHCAAYHLCGTDKNCELLLFNLRRNCSKILNTDQQVVICDTHSMNKILEEKRITESIIKGFENNEFKMYLQFIVDNKTKQIVSAEALSRWDSRDKGLIGPVKYIESMGNAGLISRHDFYMFELACRQLEAWDKTEYGYISISCNFTRITLSEENFIDKVKMISNAYTFDKSKLSIEITEDAIEKNRETVIRNVVSCKELGFKAYLDDLGSGFTSLANLCDYPVDVVKIDRDILLKTETKKGKDLFSGIVALAHSLNIRVICEGVETKEQETFVSESECDFVQGWYYSKVLPLEECESFVSEHKKRFPLIG